ncbi:HlyD family efflux transporter periplasmic adaptor subunit [Paraferrimonas haliotis]|uniref:HlyD family efflux transporter periplasmic adaptor subunit n=1 Tax=Paraferrimonas haliotis TaxID=2013866 RepID=UPI000BA95C7E|nr:HlyD family efflux transporter periplasmic adaptor subunit [Paraferrimonas haliotis]
MNGLFRKQAVTHQQQRLEGEVCLLQPLALTTSIAIILVTFLAIAVFVISQDYARKETVFGYLRPNAGLIKVYPPQNGTLTELLVTEGQLVEKGQVLAKLQLHTSAASNPALAKQITQALQQQLAQRQQERTHLRQLHNQQLQRAQQQKQELTQALETHRHTGQLLAQRAQLHKSQLQQHQALAQQGFIAKTQITAQQDQLYQIRQELSHNQSQQLSLEQQISQLSSDIRQLPISQAMTLSNNQQQISELEQRLLHNHAQLQSTITASASGRVTTIRSHTGQFRTSNQPLLSILPSDSELIAELLLPTRSAGFIDKGQQARIRLDAFPYQKYGFIDTEIVELDQSLLLQNESMGPYSLSEPVYRVRAKLEQQSINAFGNEFPLRSGMLFQADIILEQQSLLQWLLSPISSLRGRVS